MGKLAMLMSMIRAAQKELGRQDLTVDYIVTYSVEHGFLRPSEEDRSDQEIARLTEWLFAYVDIQRADVPNLFRVISDRLAMARVSADAGDENADRDALLNLDLAGVARARLVEMIRKQTQGVAHARS